MSIYIRQLIKLERRYRILKAKGVSTFDPQMIELRRMIAKTISILEG